MTASRLRWYRLINSGKACWKPFITSADQLCRGRKWPSGLFQSAHYVENRKQGALIPPPDQHKTFASFLGDDCGKVQSEIKRSVRGKWTPALEEEWWDVAVCSQGCTELLVWRPFLVFGDLFTCIHEASSGLAEGTGWFSGARRKQVIYSCTFTGSEG